MKKRNYDDNPVEKRIYDTYPVTKKEKKCALHKAKMEAKRFELRKRLITEGVNEAQSN